MNKVFTFLALRVFVWVLCAWGVSAIWNSIHIPGIPHLVFANALRLLSIVWIIAEFIRFDWDIQKAIKDK